MPDDKTDALQRYFAKLGKRSARARMKNLSKKRRSELAPNAARSKAGCKIRAGGGRVAAK